MMGLILFAKFVLWHIDPIDDVIILDLNRLSMNCDSDPIVNNTMMNIRCNYNNIITYFILISVKRK